MKFVYALVSLLLVAAPLSADSPLETDVVKTSGGDLEITFIGHGSLMFQYGGKTIHIDPFGSLADYKTLPKAEVVLLTHHHRDHLDVNALADITTDKTMIVLTKTCSESVPNGMVMENGDEKTVAGIKVEAVPAYNLVHTRQDGSPFHPKGEGSGYVLTFGDTRVYVAGDTENTPEMKSLKNIDVAFLPMNLPYTMTPEMVADAAKAFKPRILYPYHFGETDTSRLVELMKDEVTIEVRIRTMK